MKKNGISKDAVSKLFFSFQVNFADTYNLFAYDGKDVIRPEDLTPADPSSLVPAEDDMETERYRDVFKRLAYMTDGKRNYLLLGIESQSSQDRLMAARVLIYNLAKYNEQYREMMRRKKEGKKIPQKPFKPVITLVVNLSGRKWAYPTDFMSIVDLDDRTLGKYIINYEMPLLDPYAIPIEKLKSLRTDVAKLFTVMALNKDKEGLDEYLNSLSPDEGTVEPITARMLEKFASFRIPKKPAMKEGRFNMCIAQKELISESSRKAHAKGHAEGREEGLTIGREEGLTIGRKEGVTIGREEGLIIGRVIEKIKYIRKGADTLEEAAQDIGITVDEFLKIAEQNGCVL